MRYTVRLGFIAYDTAIRIHDVGPISDIEFSGRAGGIKMVHLASKGKNAVSFAKVRKSCITVFATGIIRKTVLTCFSNVTSDSCGIGFLLIGLIICDFEISQLNGFLQFFDGDSVAEV